MTKIRELLERKLINDVVGAPEDMPAAEAAAILAKKRIGILVCRAAAGGMAGVLSERDIVRAVSERGGDLTGLTAADLITRNVQTCSPDDDMKAVVGIMGRGGFRHMPVIDGDRTVGVISVTDIFRFILENRPHDRVDVLKSYYCGSIP